MNIYQYTALKNPKGSAQVLESYGIRSAGDPRIVSQQLAFCVAKKGQEALDKIAQVHPDYFLVESRVKQTIPATVVVEEKKETQSNACGCSSCSGHSNFSNANGQSIKADVTGRLSTTQDIMITGGLVLIGLVIVLKLIK